MGVVEVEAVEVLRGRKRVVEEEVVVAPQGLEEEEAAALRDWRGEAVVEEAAEGCHLLTGAAEAAEVVVAPMIVVQVVGEYSSGEAQVLASRQSG